MRLYYQGIDITDSVDIKECVFHDTAGERCDSLEMTLEHADAWHMWQPETDDTVEVTEGDYTTGALYINAIIPEGDSIRLYATATNRAARRMTWDSYSGKTLEEVMNLCAAETGMKAKLYGIDGNLTYDYLLRKWESCAGLLSRILKCEGAVLKCTNGTFTAIGIEAAQKLNAYTTMTLTHNDSSFTLRNRNNLKYGSLRVITPYAMVEAHDTNATDGNTWEICGLPADDAATAGRWARGILLFKNRKAEELETETELNTGFTAMARVDVDGGTDADGAWLIDTADHDFINRKTTVTLLRVTDGVI